MTRFILAAAAAFALVSAAPAFACPDCKDCPMHKDKVAANDKAAAQPEKKDAEKKCACGMSAKDCKCADGKCECAKKDEKKDAKKS